MEQEKYTVLIVDDNVDNLKILISFLKDNGYLLRIAENGERAIAGIKKDRPDLILLDIMMPGLDGFETCQKIKEMEETEDIPIIFMTALSDIEDKIMGFGVGGVDYITKPFQQQEVLARISTHISLSKRKIELKKALESTRTLPGILPICSYCKKIRDIDDCWDSIEAYLSKHTDIELSHGICPTCFDREMARIDAIKNGR